MNWSGWRKYSPSTLSSTKGPCAMLQTTTKHDSRSSSVSPASPTSARDDLWWPPDDNLTLVRYLEMFRKTTAMTVAQPLCTNRHRNEVTQTDSRMHDNRVYTLAIGWTVTGLIWLVICHSLWIVVSDLYCF